VSVGMSLLAILEEGPTYGLRLKHEFEGRTGHVWPLNVGQVYTTLGRLERDGLVRAVPEGSVEGQKVHEITEAGQARLAEWFARATMSDPPARDELVLKLVMTVDRPGVEPAEVIQAERRRAVEQLREYTRLKPDGATEELGWQFLLDSLIFQTEARVRWLDACEARLRRAGPRPGARRPVRSSPPAPQVTEVRR
jgi:DNA-binding PadR family transcriptional regulator